MNLAWENETSFSPTQPGLQTVHQISPCFLLPVAHPIHTVNLARKQLGCSFWSFPSPYPCQKEIDAGAPTSPAQVVIVAHSPAALLPPPLPPLSSLCNSKLLSINQIKRFCLLKSCQLPPIASSHRFVQGLTQPACACSVTSSPHPPTPSLCSSASGLGLGTHQASSLSRAPACCPSAVASRVCAWHAPLQKCVGSSNAPSKRLTFHYYSG